MSGAGRLVACLLALAGLGWGLLAVGSHADAPISVWWLMAVLAFQWGILGAILGIPALRMAVGWRPVWIAAVVFRLCGALAIPLFEDDHHRFLWDGYVFAQTGNPYATAPADWFDDPTVPEAFQEVLDRVNHPEVPTIYGPVTEAAFLLSYYISPAALWPWKLLLVAADLGCLLLLWRHAAAGAARAAVAFAAWCPLSIFETSFNAHPDALGVTLLVGALLARSSRKDLWLGVWCGAAVAAKVFAILLVPFLLWGRGLRSWVTCAATALLLYLPFWLQGGTADLKGLRTFAGEWEFNSSLFALLKAGFDSKDARLAGLLIFGGVWLMVFRWWTRRPAAGSAPPPGLLVLGSFFLLSPTFNPWYALWLLPFVALRPTPTGIALLAAVSLSYLTRHNLGDAGLHGFNHPVWVRPVEFGLIAMAGVFEITREWRRARSSRVDADGK